MLKSKKTPRLARLLAIEASLLLTTLAAQAPLFAPGRHKLQAQQLHTKKAKMFQGIADLNTTTFRILIVHRCFRAPIPIQAVRLMLASRPPPVLPAEEA